MNEIYHGDSLDVLQTFEPDSIDLIITSPPFYKLRDYKIQGQLGQEKTPQEYIANLMAIMTECKRVLKKTGSLWVNISDSHHKKSLIGIPEKFVEAMEKENWIRRNTIIWNKPDAMISSVKDRFTIDFDYFYFWTKSRRYYFKTQYQPYSERTIKGYNSHKGKTKFAPIGGIKHLDNGNKTYSGNEFIPNKEGSIKRCVWKIPTNNFKGAHYAIFPESLVEVPIKACSVKDGIILDPFFGSGTVGVVAKRLERNYIGIEINEADIKMAQARISQS